MNELNQVFINGLVSILVVVIGLAFQELRKYLQAKINQMKIKEDLKQYELIKKITETVVTAVEQVFKDGQSEDKFKLADTKLTAELNKAGIYLDAESKKVLIESVVNGLNQLKNIEE